MRSVVVFPAPLGPRKPKISPSCTVMSTPLTASTLPPRVLKLFFSPIVEIIMIVILPWDERLTRYVATSQVLLLRDMARFFVGGVNAAPCRDCPAGLRPETVAAT